MSSANAFILEQSKTLSSGNALKIKGLKVLKSDWMVCNAVFDISVILWQLVHLSMLSGGSFHQYSAKYNFQATGCLPT